MPKKKKPKQNETKTLPPKNKQKNHIVCFALTNHSWAYLRM